MACIVIAGQLLTTPTQQPNDVAYEEVPGPTHYNDPCQPIPLENNEAYSVHKSGNERSTEMPGETYSQVQRGVWCEREGASCCH